MRRPLLRAALVLVAAVALGGGAAAVASAQSSSAGPQISRSTDAVGGRTVVAWAAPFARYTAERATRADCSRGQRGLVFFIPDATGPRQSTSCTVPAGQPILVSPAGFLCVVPDRRFCTATERINDVRRVAISIDGVPVTVRQFDWVSRQSFRVDGRQASVSAYVYIISGLAPGRHAIATSATVRQLPGPGLVRVGMTAAVTVQ